MISLNIATPDPISPLCFTFFLAPLHLGKWQRSIICHRLTIIVGIQPLDCVKIFSSKLKTEFGKICGKNKIGFESKNYHDFLTLCTSLS
jgi:hypothetical protein